MAEKVDVLISENKKPFTMHIADRRKKGYIAGRKVAPTKIDPSYDEWEAVDTLVKSWLMNAMIEKLMAHFVQYGMAKEVWDAIRRSYLDVSNSSQVYKLMKKFLMAVRSSSCRLLQRTVLHILGAGLSKAK